MKLLAIISLGSVLIFSNSLYCAEKKESTPKKVEQENALWLTTKQSVKDAEKNA